MPPVDVYETDKNELVIKAELPEMKREAIAVTVEHGALTISGERTPGDDVPSDAYRRVERPYGKFARRFTLPRSVDASKVAAEYKDGVLTVRLPMREEAKPRTRAGGAGVLTGASGVPGTEWPGISDDVRPLLFSVAYSEEAGMMSLLLHWVVLAVALWVASRVVPGVVISSWGALAIGAAVLGRGQHRGASGDDHPDLADHSPHARAVLPGGQRRGVRPGRGLRPGLRGHLAAWPRFSAPWSPGWPPGSWAALVTPSR